MKKLFLITLVLFHLAAAGQITKKVLFLGNSLTYVNNLPQMIADAAASTGDTLIFDSNCIGGYHLYDHYGNTVSKQKIMAGGWDYVVLQDQSLLPALDTGSVNFSFFPYAYKLDSMIDLYNPCGRTMFYMTWGYKNGCVGCLASWPYIETYSGMDSLLNLRYSMAGDSNQAEVSPVVAVWHYVRNNFPSIELYQADEVHPSVAGTYAGACCFYSVIFRKDPTLITFNSSLSANDAVNFRNAAKIIAYDSLMNWNVGEYDLVSNFSYSNVSGYSYQFTNLSQNATGQIWNFGAATDTSVNPVFTFAAPGTYPVQLIVFNACDSDTSIQVISPVGINEIDLPEQVSIYPNPAVNQLSITNYQSSIKKLEFFNVLGEKVFELQTSKLRPQAIDISQLAAGIYFLKISGNFTTTKKLVVQK